MTKIVINNCFGGFSLSLAATQWLAEQGLLEATQELNNSERFCEYEGEIFFSGFHCELPRHHSLLVRCVEALGEAASGESAKLIIREISGNQYIIKEYDGAEKVVEPKDIKWVTV